MDRIMTGGGWALTLVCSQKAVAMADSKKRGMKWFIPSSWGKDIAYAPLGQSVGRKRKSAQVLPVQARGTRGRWKWMMCMGERFLSGLHWQRKRTRYSGCKGMFGVNVPATLQPEKCEPFLRTSSIHVSWGEGRLLRSCQGSSLVLHKTKVRMKCPPTRDIRQKGWTQILWTKWKSSDEFTGCIAGVRTNRMLHLY